MTKPGLILIGAGGHAQACIDVIEQLGCYDIVGFVGLPAEVGREIFGYRVVASDEQLSGWAGDRKALISIGQIDSPDDRIRLFAWARRLGFEFPAIISPLAYVSRRAVIGAGTIVMHGAVINAGARVGENCIINSHSLLEHGVQVGDHCHISTGAILNGSVTVGAGGFIGSGSVVRNGISVGKRCFVGMSASINRDLADATRWISNQRYD